MKPVKKSPAGYSNGMVAAANSTITSNGTSRPLGRGWSTNIGESVIDEQYRGLDLLLSINFPALSAIGAPNTIVVLLNRLCQQIPPEIGLSHIGSISILKMRECWKLRTSKLN